MEIRSARLAAGAVLARPLTPVLALGVGAVAMAFGALVAERGEGGLAVAAGMVAVVTVGVVTLVRPDIAALILVALVPVLSGVKRGFPVPGFRLSELLIGGIGALILITATSEQRVRWRSFDWIALAYACTAALVGAYALQERGVPFTNENVGKLLAPFQFFILYRAAITALPSPAKRRFALKLLLAASIPVATLAVLQQLDLAGVRAFAEQVTAADATRLSKDPDFVLGSRATGPFPAWHTLGGYLFLVILVGAGALLEQRSRLVGSGKLLLALGLAGVALVATGTAAPIFGAVVGAVLLGLWYRRVSRIVAFIAIGAVVGAVLFGPLIQNRLEQQLESAPGQGRTPQTLAFRYEVWTEQYLPLLSDGRWLIGYGTEPPPGVEWEYTETIYVTMLMRGGVLLLFAYCLLMCALAAGALRQSRDSDPERRLLGRVLFVAVVLLVFMHLVSSYFVTSGLPHLIWLLAALLFANDGYGVARRAESTPGRLANTAEASSAPA